MASKIRYLKNGERGYCNDTLDGSRFWTVKGPVTEYITVNEDERLHNEDGPAFQYTTSSSFPVQLWYIDGTQYEFDEWCEKLNKTAEDIFMLRLVHGF